MKAHVVHDFEGLDALRWEETDPPDPGPGEVVIRTAACGVNFPDSLMVAGRYQLRPELPFSPGFEVSGTVARVGEGVDLQVGTRVAGHPMFGAFSEEALVPANRVFPIPDSLDDETAAGLLVNYGTSFNALKRRAALQPGETLVVLGAAGGVGIAAVELGVAMGARVIAVASTPEKLALCRDRGAHELIDYSTCDLRAEVARLTGDQGVDVVYDPVGGAHAEPMIRSLRCDGRYLVIGFASGEIPSIRLNLPLLKIASIVGVFWGAWIDLHPEETAVDMAELFQFAADGRIRPHVSEVFELADAVEAVRRVAGRQTLGKVVLRATR